MRIQKKIERKIREALQPHHLTVLNESHQHNVPPGSQSHFKVIVVTPRFEGKSLLERHRILHQLLADELKETIHALSLETFSPEEWKDRGETVCPTPECLGGSKK